MMFLESLTLISNSMRDITVLSTACGAFFMPGFFLCLRNNHERKVRIVGCDVSNDPSHSLFVDSFYQVPPLNDVAYVDSLLDICKKENVDVFFPQISMELPVVLARIDEFKALNVNVAITDDETLNIANNKYRLYEFMREHNIETPRYFKVESSSVLSEKIGELGYPERPVVLKMTENSGSRGVRVVMPCLSKGDFFMHGKPSSLNVSLSEMCDIIDDCQPTPELIAMEYFPGVEYTVDLLAEKGKTLYIAGRRNLTSNMSIAQTSVVERNDYAYQLCQEIVEKLKLDGNIGFDFMMDENDKPWLTDLNPRVTATVILYAGAGLNLPYLRVKHLLGEDLPSVDVEYGTRLVRKYNDVLYKDNKIINW